MCTERVRKAAHGLRPGALGSPLTPEMQPVRMGGTRTTIGEKSQPTLVGMYTR